MDESCLITKEYVNTFLKKRGRELHKGDCGRVLLVSGSVGMVGAAVLCARAALRSGAGLVRVSLPEALFPIVQIGVPEATCLARNISDPVLLSHQGIAIGPGLGEDDAHVLLIKNILHTVTVPVILDGDALTILSRNANLLEGCRAPVILTPHPGEAGRLLDISAKEVNEGRKEAALAIAKRFSAVTALKGAGTIVATSQGKTYINTTGNPAMATAGSGDVLTGVIAALAAQGLGALEAAACGVYLHGLAGDIGAGVMGEYGLIASDIAAYMGIALGKTIGPTGLEK